jgi:excisionase family DNA binding protein
MYEWISVGEASRRLNVSPSTVRRMIEAGALVGERQVLD